MTRDTRITLAALEMTKSSEVLINALLDALPPELAEEDNLQQAMLTYMEGAAKFQADAAMFMAQSKVSNG